MPWSPSARPFATPPDTAPAEQLPDSMSMSWPRDEIEAEFVEQQANSEIAMENVRIRYAADSAVPWTINVPSTVIAVASWNLMMTPAWIVRVSPTGTESAEVAW